MDAKEVGNRVLLVGNTRAELGGSHLSLVRDLKGGYVPKVDPHAAKRTFYAMHQAIRKRLVRACHDLSEGGLAVAIAEMTIAGGLGIAVDLSAITSSELNATMLLFSESNTRFVVEVTPENHDKFVKIMLESGVPVASLGTIESEPSLSVSVNGTLHFSVKLDELKQAWIKPLDW
jgi:phosphoribosylformylglycinamidine synthase